ADPVVAIGQAARIPLEGRCGAVVLGDGPRAAWRQHPEAVLGCALTCDRRREGDGCAGKSRRGKVGADRWCHAEREPKWDLRERVVARGRALISGLDSNRVRPQRLAARVPGPRVCGAVVLGGGESATGRLDRET